MDNTMTENKPKRSDYQKELRQRVQRFLNEEVTTQCVNCGGALDAGFADEIYSLVREVALESYRNGQKAPRRKGAFVKGSAVVNGRLKRVEEQA